MLSALLKRSPAQIAKEQEIYRRTFRAFSDVAETFETTAKSLKDFNRQCDSTIRTTTAPDGLAN